MFLRTLLKKSLVYKKLKNKIINFFDSNMEPYSSEVENLFATVSELKKENFELRFKVKKLLSEKVNVVFVCWRPSVWASLKTVYESMKADDLFNVKIVVIPNKKQLNKLGFNHDCYESEGGENYWIGDDVIHGYNYETKEWLDLRTLKADYICFQRPYNVERPDCLKSSVVSNYAKLFYVAYFAYFNCNEDDFINYDCTPLGFMKDLSFYFTQNEDDQKFMTKRMEECKNTNVELVMTGFPRFDDINKTYDINKTIWKNKSENRFRIIWTPRWCTNENNCHFFDYKNKLVDYCKNEDNIDFIFRPHPQAFINWEATGELPKNEADLYKSIYDESANMCIDYQKDYLSTFYTSDCLITDTSSMVAEYFLTGKPIIYCYKQGSLNSFAKHKGYTDGFYWVENWEQLESVLNKLKTGNDPLKEKRKELMKTAFYMPDEKSGFLIKEAIKKDFLNA